MADRRAWPSPSISGANAYNNDNTPSNQPCASAATGPRVCTLVPFILKARERFVYSRLVNALHRQGLTVTMSGMH